MRKDLTYLYRRSEHYRVDKKKKTHHLFVNVITLNKNFIKFIN